MEVIIMQRLKDLVDVMWKKEKKVRKHSDSCEDRQWCVNYFTSHGHQNCYEWVELNGGYNHAKTERSSWCNVERKKRKKKRMKTFWFLWRQKMCQLFHINLVSQYRKEIGFIVQSTMTVIIGVNKINEIIATWSSACMTTINCWTECNN